MKAYSTRQDLEFERGVNPERTLTGAYHCRAIVIVEAGHMYNELGQKMREIIWRRWTSGEYPTLNDLHPNIYTGEIYDELIESGIGVPPGAMEQLLKLWMSQGYIRTRAIGALSGDKQCHGSMKIVAVYESLGVS